jgi:DNA-binding GntR family transcriptional regulator
LTDQSHWARQRTIARYEIGERSDREHAAIIQAIKARDGEAAARVVRQHRTSGGAAMVELLTGTSENR